MFKNHKLLAVPLIAAMSLFCAFALSACGSADKVSDEDLIKEAVAADFDQIKNYDEEFMSKIISSDVEATFSEIGMSATDFMKVYLEGFDYSVNSVTVDGDTAQVEMVMTCKTYDQLMEAANNASEALLADPDVYNYSEEELYAKLGELLMTEMQAAEPVEGEVFTLTYVKNGDTWELEDTQENSEAISNHLIAAPAE